MAFSPCCQGSKAVRTLELPPTPWQLMRPLPAATSGFRAWIIGRQFDQLAQNAGLASRAHCATPHLPETTACKLCLTLSPRIGLDQCERCSTDCRNPTSCALANPPLLKGWTTLKWQLAVRRHNATTTTTMPIAHQTWMGFCPIGSAVFVPPSADVLARNPGPEGIPNTLMPWSAVGMSEPLHTVAEC